MHVYNHVHLKGVSRPFRPASGLHERPAGRTGLKGRPDRPGWPSATLLMGYCSVYMRVLPTLRFKSKRVDLRKHASLRTRDFLSTCMFITSDPFDCRSATGRRYSQPGSVHGGSVQYVANGTVIPCPIYRGIIIF